jgi:MoCo/4Fe-4S cofactor protein with predicted Tat translocation signal
VVARREEVLGTVSSKTTRRGSAPRRFWGTLDEYFETEDFWKWAEREFPERASEFSDPVGRREFLRVMGATLAMAGLGGACVSPGFAARIANFKVVRSRFVFGIRLVRERL